MRSHPVSWKEISDKSSCCKTRRMQIFRVWQAGSEAKNDRWDHLWSADWPLKHGLTWDLLGMINAVVPCEILWHLICFWSCAGLGQQATSVPQVLWCWCQFLEDFCYDSWPFRGHPDLPALMSSHGVMIAGLRDAWCPKLPVVGGLVERVVYPCPNPPLKTRGNWWCRWYTSHRPKHDLFSK